MVTVALACVAAADAPFAHGTKGTRVVPATDDPFVADEVSLSTISTIGKPMFGK